MDSKETNLSMLEEVEQLRSRVLELERTEQKYARLEADLDECRCVASLSRDISLTLIQSTSLQTSLQACAQALVDHLEAAFARIWTLNEATQMLELQASAGLYTHLNGPHGRIPVGYLKIGLIAEERVPQLTNMVIGDSRICDQGWAQREGMVSFAGYPLLVGGETVGVMALFGRHPLSPFVLDAMGSVSNAIALGIERKRIDEERTILLLQEQSSKMQAIEARERLTRIVDNLPDGFVIFDEDWRYVYINPQAMPYMGKPWKELLGKNVWEEFPYLLGSAYDKYYHYAVQHQESVAFEHFSERFSEWFDVHAYPIAHGLAVYFRNITDRKHKEEGIARSLEMTENARSQTEIALQMRNDFLSSISHDLKTPLTVMRGNVQLFQRRIKRGQSIGGTWSVERLSLIEASITKMNRMVDELLDVAKLQTGQQLDLDLRVFSLVPLIKRICMEQQETTPKHALRLFVSPEELFVRGDSVRLDRVLSNLLGNAIKYSPRGGDITLNVGQEEDKEQVWITIRIQDQGIGIPKKEQDRIFAPFYRAGNVEARIQGTGVGLASAMQVITQHGGSISVHSQEGEGSCFIVRLPAVRK